MARVRLRIELPHDLPVSDEQVRAAVLSGLNDLSKAETAAPRAHEHPYIQKLITRSTDGYERAMRAMLSEIQAVLSR